MCYQTITNTLTGRRNKEIIGPWLKTRGEGGVCENQYGEQWVSAKKQEMAVFHGQEGQDCLKECLHMYEGERPDSINIMEVN